MPRQRGRKPDDDLATELEGERREWLRRDTERRETERREGLAPATGARTMLAALDWPESDAWDAEDSLNELTRLVETAGGTIMGRTIQRREHPDPATFFGRGKVAEIAESRTEPGFDLLVVDSALSPVQQRNLEKRIDGPVLDRPGLIIEIFGQRAQTSEARLQVDLARLEYFLAHVPSELQVAVEMRHASWHQEATFRLLERHRSAYCVMSGANLPCVLRATSSLVYARLHGPDQGALYGGSYSEDDLRWWADRAREWEAQGREVFIYFNNDGGGNAVRNADRLRELLGQ